MWPFTKSPFTKNKGYIEPATGSYAPEPGPKWAPAAPMGHNVEVITTLSGDVHLRIAESGVAMGLKMSPNVARKLASQLNAAADAVDPDEGEDDESEEEPPSLSGIEAL